MTYNQLHTYQYELTKVLNNKFKEQLLAIDQNAMLCYQGHNEKFTISLFSSAEEYIFIKSRPESIKLETEHLELISEYLLSSKVEQLLRDLTRFIMNEGPQQSLKEQI